MAKHISFTESDYIQGILESNEMVVKALYKLCYPIVESFVTRNNGSIDEAKDIYQESFIILYYHVKDGKFQRGSSIKTYLYSISRRKWLKELSKKGRLVRNIEESESFFDLSNEDIESKADVEVQHSVMSKSLEVLGEPCSTLIQQFYIRRMSMEEIAQEHGYTNAENAKTQKYKCLQRLKKLFFGFYGREIQDNEQLFKVDRIN